MSLEIGRELSFLIMLLSNKHSFLGSVVRKLKKFICIKKIDIVKSMIAKKKHRAIIKLNKIL